MSFCNICIDKTNLLNLSYGVRIPSEITEEILALPLKGKTLLKILSEKE